MYERMLDKENVPSLKDMLHATREYWNSRYICGDGGWLNYRVLNKEEIEDIKLLIGFKQKPQNQK